MPRAWTAFVTVRRPTRESADRLARSLTPEVAREVPRAQAALAQPFAGQVALKITARDTGALRAALNTYLGWIQLADATERAIRAKASPASDSP